ncbi:MAG: polysaccharide biosynthesis/export family protein [Candidatus Hydrogenedentes bacterium]|nr:polysaccharide biosynthesis/export family protein [Candidatus Hydrogenedentota bacterium]
MSAKLATLENAQGGLEAPLRAEIQALENKLAQLENRPPQAVTVSSNNLEPRLAELRQQVEALGARGEPALAPDLSGIEERLAQTETKLAELGAEAPRVVDTTPEMVEERFQQLQAQVSALQQAQAAPPAPAEVVAAPSPSLPASPPMDASVYFEEAAIYRIGPGDQLEFTCFNDVLLSREEVLVRYDGRISLPLIPDIVVAGTTREEAEARVQNAYRSIFRNPRVSILVRGALSKVFTVVGDIQEPGMYPYEQPIRLIDAISLAGGLRDRSASAGTGGGFVGITGQLVKAFVVRRVEGERQVYEYDLRSLGKLGQHSSEAPVYPGDIIYVPEGVNLVYLLGEVDTRVVELLEGMTILQLLSLSGGFDATTARLSHVVLMRRVDDEHSEVMLVNLRRIFRNPDLDITLNPGDIVYVPQKRLVRLEEFIARFTGSISPLLGLYNDFIDARYSKRISEQLISNDTNVLQSLTELGASSAALLDVIQGNTN